MPLTIYPYKFKGSWVFDCVERNLDKEAFVQGADKILDVITKDIKGAEDGFVLEFSNKSIVGSTYFLTFLRSEFGGSWYRLVVNEASGEYIDGWLCPALFKFFPQAPKHIFICVREDNCLYNRWMNKLTKLFSFKKPNVMPS
jgi:hypothetical protein